MFRKNLLKLYCLLIMSGICASALAVNESEPNNAWNQADVITLGATGNGTAGLSQEQDWWRVTSTTDGKLTVNFTSTNGLYVYCQVYDTLGVLGFSTNLYTNSSNVVEVDGLNAGTYYIKLFAYYGTDAPTYSFVPTWTTPAQANDVEPNGTRNQAKVLNVNSSKTGHIGYYYGNVDDTLDWYKITIAQDGILQWTITSHNPGNNVFAELFDNDGVTVLGNGSYTSGTATYTSALGGLNGGISAGTYYLRIRTYYNSEFAPYTISDSLILPPVGNDAEPNGVYTQALTFNLNDTVRGHIGYYYNHLDDTLDWYKVTTTKDGRLNYQIYSLNGNNVFLQLFDGNGTTILAGGSYTSGTATYNTDGLAAGTYYFRLRTYYNSEWVPYKFIVKLIEPSRTIDVEPNDTKAQAKNINPNDSVTGHIGYQYNGARDYYDYRKITLTSNGKLEWTISSENGQNVFARLFDNDGTTIVPGSTGSYTSGTATYSADGLAPGTYYLVLNTYYNSYGGEWVPYYLKTKFYPAANDPEPNGSYANAQAINLNDSLLGTFGYYYNGARDTNDWFKLTTNNDGKLSISYTSVNSQNLRMIVYDNDGVTQLYNDYTTTTKTYSRNDLGKGTYYIQLRGYYTSEYTPYKLVNNLENNNPNDPEPNRYAKTGAVINGYTTRKGNINYYYNSAKDTTDWWRIAFYNGSLNLTINKVQHTFDSNYPDINYKLYKDTTAAAIDNLDLIGGTPHTFTYTSLTNGTYYVKLTQLNNTFGGYTITADYKDTTSQTVTQVSYSADTVCGNGKITYFITRGRAPYTVQLYRNGVATGAPVITSDTAKFTGLNTGVYYISVKGTSAVTYTVNSGTRSIVPQPAGTSNLSVTATQAIVRWSKFLCVDSLKFGWRLKGATNFNDVILPGTATRDTISGLTANTRYEWRVVALIYYNGTQYASINSVIKRFKTPVARFGETFSDDENSPVTVSIYPNPVSDKINFVIDDTAPVLNITISNALGQAVKTIHESNNSYHSVDVAALPRGVYFITIKTSTNLYTSRFVKE